MCAAIPRVCSARARRVLAWLLRSCNLLLQRCGGLLASTVALRRQLLCTQKSARRFKQADEDVVAGQANTAHYVRLNNFACTWANRDCRSRRLRHVGGECAHTRRQAQRGTLGAGSTVLTSQCIVNPCMKMPGIYRHRSFLQQPLGPSPPADRNPH